MGYIYPYTPRCYASDDEYGKYVLLFCGYCLVSYVQLIVIAVSLAVFRFSKCLNFVERIKQNSSDLLMIRMAWIGFMLSET